MVLATGVFVGVVLAADAFVGGELTALLDRLGSKRLGSNLASTLFLYGSVLAEIDLKYETPSQNWGGNAKAHLLAFTVSCGRHGVCCVGYVSIEWV